MYFVLLLVTILSLLTIFQISILKNYCLQCFPALGSFPASQLFTSGGQSIEASASASILPMNIQG